MGLTKTQNEFAIYLADCWSTEIRDSSITVGDVDGILGLIRQGSAWHCYEISNHRCWNDWRTGATPGTTAKSSLYDGLRRTHWWCNSLKQAGHHYSWTHSTIGTFTSLSSDLKTAIYALDEHAAASVSLNIFKWGGVGRKSTDQSRVWLEDQLTAKTLIKSINDAVALLQPGCITPLNRFKPGDLLMNSALTKVYAAADMKNQVIIYDGRVGAALGLLARVFLEKKNYVGVPPDLAFLWGRSPTPPINKRNPSLGKFRFGETYGQTDQTKAEVARFTNEILTETLSLLNNLGAGVSMRDLEQSLFMIGYDIRYGCRLTGTVGSAV